MSGVLFTQGRLRPPAVIAMEDCALLPRSAPSASARPRTSKRSGAQAASALFRMAITRTCVLAAAFCGLLIAVAPRSEHDEGQKELSAGLAFSSGSGRFNGGGLRSKVAVDFAGSSLAGLEVAAPEHGRAELVLRRISKAEKARLEGVKRLKAREAAAAKKPKDDVIEMKGMVLQHSRNVFKVQLENGIEVQCTLAGKLRLNRIKVLEGDQVTVEMSPFDLTRGRITFRTIDKSAFQSPAEKKAKKEEDDEENDD
eukprot:TRINITY_DN102342_c0_g1_i1.p1 TRINITY_DN102342_c0_g1~~TRINITY_DN102342_c0_g1_i1.p1  ORF type:complete len:255 (-),score=75.29 TRINITY_DN102342_c0_g1_i1:85-849(-)